MTTIVAGEPAKFPVQLLTNGKPVPVSGSVQASVYNQTGTQKLIDERDAFEDAEGADWPAGIVVVEFDGADTGLLSPGNSMLVLKGSFGIKRFRLVVETMFEPTRTSLFIKDIVVQELREDRLMAAAAGAFQDIEVSDIYLWDKIRAAESEIAHTLRVPLVPTRFFPSQPTQEQLDDLNGMPWVLEIGTDYDPSMFDRDKWGLFVTRQRPVISIERFRFVYPTENMGFYDIPLDWINLDAKYGHIRIVPNSSAILTSFSGFVLTNLISGRTIPSMIQVIYTAGLTDVETNYPELIDCIKKKAVLKVIADAFLPQSGSISADGLSQSMSVDMAKYHETVDHILNGPDGSNGGLMSKIHGIRTMVI